MIAARFTFNLNSAVRAESGELRRVEDLQCIMGRSPQQSSQQLKPNNARLKTVLSPLLAVGFLVESIFLDFKAIFC